MNKILLVSFASMLSLAGCGVDLQTACENYINAYNTCSATAYGVDDGTYDIDATSTCSAYDGIKGKAASADADYLQCLADAYNNADCSTTDGLTAASTEASNCTVQM